jgi:hypothetical protein
MAAPRVKKPMHAWSSAVYNTDSIPHSKTDEKFVAQGDFIFVAPGMTRQPGGPDNECPDFKDNDDMAVTSALPANRDPGRSQRKLWWIGLLALTLALLAVALFVVAFLLPKTDNAVQSDSSSAPSTTVS